MDSIYNPEISDNSIDSHFPPSKESDLISQKPYLPPTTAVPSSKFPSTSNGIKSTPMPVKSSNITFEFVSSSTKHPVSTSTEKYTVTMGSFNTTLGILSQRNTSTVFDYVKNPIPLTTTENIQLSTFHSVQNKNKTTILVSTTSKPITHTTTVRTTIKKSTLKPVHKNTPRPTVPSRKPIRNTVSSNLTSTTKPVVHNNVTRKSTVSPIKNVIITTAKPIVTITKITTKNSASSHTQRPTTQKPSSTIGIHHNFTKPTNVSSTPIMTTISYVETTKAPRPKPQPTDYIIKVQPSTIMDDDVVTISSSIIVDG